MILIVRLNFDKNHAFFNFHQYKDKVIELNYILSLVCICLKGKGALKQILFDSKKSEG